MYKDTLILTWSSKVFIRNFTFNALYLYIPFLGSAANGDVGETKCVTVSE